MVLDVGVSIADRYKLLKQLGRGGFSEVWLAEDSLTNVQVAIKIYAPGMGLDDAGISLFTQEFSLVFDMNQTNLLHPTYYDCWQRMPYLILPFCKNGSVFKYVQGGGNQISEEESWKLLHDVAEGLAYLHAKNPPIIHQDIKPDNILISDEGVYMITDFGISARIRSTLRKNKSQESSGGTLAYMGPERFSQSPTPIMASDVWSLGATMYELLTGMPPYGEHGGVLQKNGADIPLIEENYSDELKDIIYKCLALNTWDRPTARQLADYTYAHIHGESTSGILPDNTPDTSSDEEATDNVQPTASKEEQANDNEISKPQQKSNPKKIIIPAAILIVIIAIGIILFLSKGEEPEPIAEPVVPTIDYNEMCRSIIEEGMIEERQGDAYRFQIDTLEEGDEYVFEDYYINAINKYSQVEYYKDSIEASVYLNAEERTKQVQSVLDSAYQALTKLSETMKQFKQEAAAKAFDNRASKIERYINK